MTGHWLLDVELDGRVYRWSVERVEVDNADGDTFVYEVGLEDPGSADSEAGEADVSVSDPSIDWPATARLIEGAPATLRWWTEGTVLERAVCIARGLGRDPSWGTRHDPVSFEIAQRPAAFLGHRMPDDTSAVSDQTWPQGGASFAGPASNQCFGYPVVFGYPGYIAGIQFPVCVVPVPIGEWKLMIAHAVVCEDGAAQVTEVRIRDDDRQTETAQTVDTFTDLLGRQVRCAELESAGYDYFPSSYEARVYAAYYPDGGTPIASTAYEVLEYSLRRWAPDSTDWTRLPGIREFLGQFQVDTWINDQVSDPWSWFEGEILRDIIGVEVRTSRRGRYLLRIPSVAMGRPIAHLDIDERSGTRLANPSLHADPLNEFTARFRADREGNWLGRTTVYGDADVTIHRQPTYYSASQQTTFARNGRCTASVARFGRREDPSGAIDIDWTWNEPTIVRLLELRAEQFALPAVTVSYELDGPGDLREGDEITLTDSELGWDEVPAIVDAPVQVGTRCVVDLRLPEAG